MLKFKIDRPKDNNRIFGDISFSKPSSHTDERFSDIRNNTDERNMHWNNQNVNFDDRFNRYHDEVKSLSLFAHDQDKNKTNIKLINKFLISICLFGSFAFGCYFLYKWINPPIGEYPMMIGDECVDYKTRPMVSGGVVIPHQDKFVYDNIANPGIQRVERLAPPQPMYNEYHPQQKYAYPMQSQNKIADSNMQTQNMQPQNTQLQPAYNYTQRPMYQSIPQPQNQQQNTEAQQNIQYAPNNIQGDSRFEQTRNNAPIQQNEQQMFYFVNIGTLPSNSLAEEEARRIKAKYYEFLEYYDIDIEATSNGFTVVIGPFVKKTDAINLSSKLGFGSRVFQR